MLGKQRLHMKKAQLRPQRLSHAYAEFHYCSLLSHNLNHDQRHGQRKGEITRIGDKSGSRCSRASPDLRIFIGLIATKYSGRSKHVHTPPSMLAKGCGTLMERKPKTSSEHLSLNAPWPSSAYLRIRKYCENSPETSSTEHGVVEGSPRHIVAAEVFLQMHVFLLALIHGC